MLVSASEQTEMTVEELAARVGAIPLRRVRVLPPPGEATEQDLERLRETEGVLCELIDGVLVEKAAGGRSSFVRVLVSTLLTNFVVPRKLGWILGPDGFVWLTKSRLRAPGASFVRRDQRPDGKLLEKGYAHVAPALAVEIFSPGNTSREMDQKRREFFAAGTELFWIVYPDRQEVEISTGPEAHRMIGRDDVLDGGAVLPGFAVKVSEIFEGIDLN